MIDCPFRTTSEVALQKNIRSIDKNSLVKRKKANFDIQIFMRSEQKSRTHSMSDVAKQTEPGENVSLPLQIRPNRCQPKEAAQDERRILPDLIWNMLQENMMTSKKDFLCIVLS